MYSDAEVPLLYDARKLGSYNRLNFEIRLDPALGSLLSGIRSGAYGLDGLPVEVVDAFAVSFHETIHWWQHIGSTTGFMLSMAYPAQAHVNFGLLRQSLRDFGPKKSILGFQSRRRNDTPHSLLSGLNQIINNWHDVEFNCRLIVDPKECQRVVESPHFESVGHSLHMGLAHTLWLLLTSFDPSATFLPDPRKWGAGFEDLRKRQVPGYYHGEQVKLFDLGARAIFEGQARFSEVQYLHLASGQKLQWIDFEKQGMFGEIYYEAFEKFLKLTGIAWPDSPIHPTVQLFLLVCDLALNPNDGYPFEIFDYESFIVSNDPSYRFAWFATQIASKKSLQSAVHKCGLEQYQEVSSVLCRSMGCRTPVEIANKIAGWCSGNEALAALLREDHDSTFSYENLPVRVCFAKHLRFMQDKASTPQFFCWPAVHFADAPNVKVDVNTAHLLWTRHQPLFIADIGGDIQPILDPSMSKEATYRTFNDFYRFIITYDMVRQWIVQDGPFTYDLSWLTNKYTSEQVKRAAGAYFRSAFDVDPDDFSD